MPDNHSSLLGQVAAERGGAAVKTRLVGAFALGSALSGAAGWLLLERERRRERRAPILGGWPKVVVIGAGFGGLQVVRSLEGAEADVLMLDQHNYHCFQPLLYQVATAAVEPEEIAQPVRRILGRIRNFRFRLATADRIDLEQKQVLTDDGAIPYDYLVLATGSTTNYFGMSQLESHALGLKDLDEAVELRNHLLEHFERAVAEMDPEHRVALLTFVVAGGGPTGLEYAGALAELIRLVLVNDYPALDAKDVRVILVEGAPELISMFGPALRKSALRQLRRKGVDVRLNVMVKDFDGEAVHLSDGTSIPARSLVWTAGVRATGIGKTLDVQLGRSGRVPVEQTLQLPGHPEVYVVGDLAQLEQGGEALPMLAPVAIQQGQHAARNIRRQLSSLPPQPFRFHDRGTMATIGRNQAVAQIGKLEFTGFIAWLLWLLVHIVMLIGFRNRLLVLVNWAWDYLFFDRAVRLITKL